MRPRRIPFFIFLSLLVPPGRSSAQVVGPQGLAAVHTTLQQFIPQLHAMLDSMFRANGQRYTPVRIVAYSGAYSDVNCGELDAENAWYCHFGLFEPRIYYDSAWVAKNMKQVATELGTDGDVVPIATIAHELGHATQRLLGVVHLGAEVSFEEENTADCLAGALIGVLRDRGQLEPGDREEGRRTVNLLGDFLITTAGRVLTDRELRLRKDAHGSAEERKAGFLRGYYVGPGGCTEKLGKPRWGQTARRELLRNEFVGARPFNAGQGASCRWNYAPDGLTVTSVVNDGCELTLSGTESLPDDARLETWVSAIGDRGFAGVSAGPETDPQNSTRGPVAFGVNQDGTAQVFRLSATTSVPHGLLGITPGGTAVHHLLLELHYANREGIPETTAVAFLDGRLVDFKVTSGDARAGGFGLWLSGQGTSATFGRLLVTALSP